MSQPKDNKVQTAKTTTIESVAVVEVKMPFWSMVAFMVKALMNDAGIYNIAGDGRWSVVPGPRAKDMNRIPISFALLGNVCYKTMVAPMCGGEDLLYFPVHLHKHNAPALCH